MNVLAMFGWGTSEWILIGIIAVLLFGRRLPEVGKNLGKSLMEFKHGLKGTADDLRDVDEAVSEIDRTAHEPPQSTGTQATSGESQS